MDVESLIAFNVDTFWNWNTHVSRLALPCQIMVSVHYCDNNEFTYLLTIWVKGVLKADSKLMQIPEIWKGLQAHHVHYKRFPAWKYDDDNVN